MNHGLAIPRKSGNLRSILCVNPNPAIDKVVTVENYALNAIHRPQAVVASPGGKGCNVARVLRALGESPVVTGWVGGYAGRFIESGLRAEGIRAAFVHTQFESRTCLSVLDPAHHTMTEIYERGEPISRVALAAFRRRYRALLPSCSLVTLSGSLPAQVPGDFYAELITTAREAGVPALLDTSGESLRLGLEARPRLVKPNRYELCALVGQDLASQTEVAEVAKEVAHCWKTDVVVSLGAEGAIAATGHGIWYAQPPAVAAVSTVGSGDAMLAGLASGLTHDYSFVDSLRLGIAAGAANTLNIGAGQVRPEDVKSILAGVIIQQLA